MKSSLRSDEIQEQFLDEVKPVEDGFDRVILQTEYHAKTNRLNFALELKPKISDYFLFES